MLKMLKNWRRNLANWLTDGDLSTLKAEKEIAAQMVRRAPESGAS